MGEPWTWGPDQMLRLARYDLRGASVEERSDLEPCCEAGSEVIRQVPLLRIQAIFNGE